MLDVMTRRPAMRTLKEFERWLAEGLRRLDDHLRERGASEVEAERSRAQLEALPLAGLLAFLAGAAVSADGGEPTGHEWISRAAASASEGEELSPADLEEILWDILGRRHRPAEILTDPQLRRRLLERLIEKALAEANVPVTPEEVRRIAALLETGEFLRDFGSAAAAVVSVLPEMPLAIAGDVARSPKHVAQVTAALAADLGKAPAHVAAILSDLRSGRTASYPALLTRTLQQLYEIATLEAVVATLRAWLDPNNETVRLAILLYARAHGLPLEQGDLDAVLLALDAENPDLGPLLIAAWDHLEARLGPAGLANVLLSLGAAEASERQRE